MKLNDYISHEGLVPSSSLKWDGDQLRLPSGETVWVEPKANDVVAILRQRPDLWEIAKIRVSFTHWISARAPIFGVPFDVALHKLLNIRQLRDRPIKSMFQRVDAHDLESKGVVATMVAHLSFDNGAAGPEITLEMWQIPNVDAETFYIHGIFLVNDHCFVHLDGATMYHDTDAIERLFRHGRKTKGHQKEKYFRLDGSITIDDVRKVGSAFLPLEDLSTEYLLTQHDAGDGEAKELELFIGEENG